MHYAFDVPIRAPCEQVFDYLADPANRTLWQRSITSFEMEPQGEPRVGVRWRESVRGGITFDMEISEYERPIRWAERIQSKSHEGTITLQFTHDEDGTRVRLIADLRSKGLWRLVEPIAGLVLKREMRKDLLRVESLLASGD